MLQTENVAPYTTVTNTYNGEGEQTAVIDPTGATTRTLYDADGNVAATIDADAIETSKETRCQPSCRPSGGTRTHENGQFGGAVAISSIYFLSSSVFGGETELTPSFSEDDEALRPHQRPNHARRG
jgi:YD repeat-containing protein